MPKARVQGVDEDRLRLALRKDLLALVYRARKRDVVHETLRLPSEAPHEELRLRRGDLQAEPREPVPELRGGDVVDLDRRVRILAVVVEPELHEEPTDADLVRQAMEHGGGRSVGRGLRRNELRGAGRDGEGDEGRETH